MRHQLVVGVALLLLMGGCAALPQGVSDTRAGLSTPLAEGEASPLTEGKRVGEPIKDLPIPFSGPIGSAVGVLAGLYFANRRGRKIRLAGGASTLPALGWAGDVTKAEAVLQTAANISTGIFEVGPDGSPQRRAWKTIVGTLAGSAVLAVPGVQDWLVAHADSVQEVATGVIGLLAMSTAGVLGAEKALSVVKPVAPTPTP